MCRRVVCNECRKPTYAGCGMHVEQVLGDIPREERCTCKAQAKKSDRAVSEDASLFRRIFRL